MAGIVERREHQRAETHDLFAALVERVLVGQGDQPEPRELGHRARRQVEFTRQPPAGFGETRARQLALQRIPPSVQVRRDMSDFGEVLLRQRAQVFARQLEGIVLLVVPVPNELHGLDDIGGRSRVRLRVCCSIVRRIRRGLGTSGQRARQQQGRKEHRCRQPFHLPLPRHAG